MALSVKPEHLRRYKDIAWLLWKHGRADWVTESGLAQRIPDKFEPTEAGGPESFARDLESLGPTFVKVGQMLASRADLLPIAYIKALSRLQDKVEPIPFEQVEEVINAELPVRPSRAFSEIDPVPIAAASLAQVHGAKLRDGRDVVIKVQRPGVQDQIRVDFEAFLAIAQVLNLSAYGRRYRFESILLEFKRAIEEELDYKLEQDNLQTLRRNLEKFENLYVPKPIPDFSTSRMLVMERVAGTSVGAVSPVVFTEVDGQALADELFSAYLKQVLIDGFFHADPHPGNVMLTHDHRLALIDLGMIGRVDNQLQQHLLQLLIAVSEGRGRDAAEVALRIGTTTDHFERETYFERVATLVQQNENSAVKDLSAGR
ncbi:MAG TPA: AarF/ABC1/UbiB kinase family protein, partial [Phycisphaerae bacterium]|nr:AarF/ABC1/UbiB kinase family protein [Phycisphaerae bacterium]